jgi:MFS family permease
MLDERHPFAFRDFRLFWVARLCVMLAQNCLIVIVGGQVYDLARASMGLNEAALQLGFIGLAQFAPMLLLTPVSGWLADRFDRRLIVQLCIAAQAGCALALAWLAMSGAISLPSLFVLATLLGVGRAFYGPAQNAMGPNLVPLSVVPRAIPLNSIANRTGAILGPAAGGYLYVASSVAPYVVSAFLFSAALFCALLLKSLPPLTLNQSIGPLQQLLQGIQYIRRNQIVMGAISLDLFAGLLGGATALLPVFARDILHVGPTGLGHLHAAPAAGALLAALWFAHRPLRDNVGVKMLISVAVFGAATIAFGFSRWMPLSLFCLVVLGASDMISVFVRQSLIQILTPNELRGRVGAASTLSIAASSELGDAESGLVAALIGPVAAVVVGGVGAIVIAALWSRWFPELRTARRFEAINASA